MTAVRMSEDDSPQTIGIGNHNLTFTCTGRGRRLPPQARGQVEPSPPRRPAGSRPAEALPPLAAAAVVFAVGPGEYHFGGGMRADFAPNTPGPPNVGLGDAQKGRFVGGKWQVARQIAGDDDAQGEFLMLHPDAILRVTLYRAP